MRQYLRKDYEITKGGAFNIPVRFEIEATGEAIDITGWEVGFIAKMDLSHSDDDSRTVKSVVTVHPYAKGKTVIPISKAIAEKFTFNKYHYYVYFKPSEDEEYIFIYGELHRILGGE